MSIKKELFTEKLSEISECANHVLTSAQVALGFIMAFNTAILAVLVAIGQTINNNCFDVLKNAESVINAFDAIICLPNTIPWAACSVCAFVGGRTNLAALKMHTHIVNFYNKTLIPMYEYFSKRKTSVYGKIGSLPKISDRIKENMVERIYRNTAVCYYFLTAIFLNFTISSLFFNLVKAKMSQYTYLALFLIFSFFTCACLFIIPYKQSGYPY